MPSEAAGGSSHADIPLIEAARRGDRSAFGQLYAVYARMVHAILLARVPAQAAEDLVQEVFLQAIRSLGSLRDARSFPGWLSIIARNKASDYFRREKPWEELPEHLPGGAGPSLDGVAALAAIRSLPEAYHETLIMRLVEGMSGPEIAAQTGLTHDSVRVNLHRGMRMLREKLL
jgi:RNA polymerase sigma-70 factor, ECF subfamily